jgi:transposase
MSDLWCPGVRPSSDSPSWPLPVLRLLGSITDWSTWPERSLYRYLIGMCPSQVRLPLDDEGVLIMLILDVDAHKRSHTVVAIDDAGRQLHSRSFPTTIVAHLEALRWAMSLGDDRSWAIEDCRHLSRRLEQDLLAGGERIVRVPPKLMANVRDSARTYSKSDPIDALAVARVALREPDLPIARLDGPERIVRLLIDQREALLNERTRIIGRLRWRLHEIDPSIDPAAWSLESASNFDRLTNRLIGHDGVIVRLALGEVTRARALTVEISWHHSLQGCWRSSGSEP